MSDLLKFEVPEEQARIDVFLEEVADGFRLNRIWVDTPHDSRPMRDMVFAMGQEVRKLVDEDWPVPTLSDQRRRISNLILVSLVRSYVFPPDDLPEEADHA